MSFWVIKSLKISLTNVLSLSGGRTLTCCFKAVLTLLYIFQRLRGGKIITSNTSKICLLFIGIVWFPVLILNEVSLICSFQGHCYKKIKYFHNRFTDRVSLIQNVLHIFVSSSRNMLSEILPVTVKQLVVLPFLLCQISFWSLRFPTTLHCWEQKEFG